jgi:hypothetical protein
VKRLAKWFKENGIKPECPVCLSIVFKTGKVYRLSGPDAPGSFLDIIPVICSNCAHVRLFSAAEIL